MYLTVYMVTGYKMSRDDLWENFQEAAELISMEEPEGIAIVASEGHDDVIVGVVCNKCGEHDSGEPEHFIPPLVSQVRDKLNNLGFQVGTEDIKHWFYGTWG